MTYVEKENDMTLIEAKKTGEKRKRQRKRQKHAAAPTEVQKRFLLRTVQYMNAIKETSN